MKNLLCLCLACSLLLALAACGKKETPVSLPDPTEIETTAEEIVEVTDEFEATAEEASMEEEEAAAALEKPGTIAEIVAFYNDAANKVKEEKPGYSFTEQTSINSINGGAQWLVNIVNRAITDETPQAATIKKGDNHNDFAVPGKDWASKLEPSAVQSATCTQKGGVYEIRINMKRESQADLPRNVEDHRHGRAFKVYNAGMIYDVMAGYEGLGRIEKFAPTYRDCYIICTVDSVTGAMKTAQYYLTFDADIVGRLVSAIPIRASASISVTGKYVF